MKEIVYVLSISLTFSVLSVHSLPSKRKGPPAPQDILQFKENGTILMGRNEWRSSACKARECYTPLEKQGDCQPKYIKNLYCRGKCNSVFIPQPSNQDFKSCTACGPSVSVQENIRLECRVNGRIKIVYRRVEIVKSCKCIDVQC